MPPVGSSPWCRACAKPPEADDTVWKYAILNRFSDACTIIWINSVSGMCSTPNIGKTIKTPSTSKSAHFFSQSFSSFLKHAHTILTYVAVSQTVVRPLSGMLLLGKCTEMTSQQKKNSTAAVAWKGNGVVVAITKYRLWSYDLMAV